MIVLRPDDDLAALVDEAVARGADALGVAGGDGSLAVVAAAARAHGLPFVCVPAGPATTSRSTSASTATTWSARSTRSPTAVERRIDVAEVNGRLFLNNVSLGIYGDAVRQPAYRDAKMRTLLETAAEVLGPSSAAPELHLVDDRGVCTATPRWCSCRTTRTRSSGRGSGTRPSARRRRARYRRARRAGAPKPGTDVATTHLEATAAAPPTTASTARRSSSCRRSSSRAGRQLSASGSPPGTRFEPEIAEARRPVRPTGFERAAKRAPVSRRAASP